MTYLGDPFKDFGDYSKKEYHHGKKKAHTAKAKVPGMQGYEPSLDVIKLAERNAGVKPAGLQGYEPNLSTIKLAQRNAGVKPAGLQGYEGYEPTLNMIKLAQRNAGVKPAGLQGLQGYESYQQLDDFETGGSKELSTPEISRLAQDNMNTPPAGGSYLGESDAFEGLGDTGDSWTTFFNKASTAQTQTDLLSALRQAVASVPDNTPANIRKQYYDMAKQMLNQRRSTNLHHLDVQHVELESNLGWLISPNLVPKTGGFGRSVSTAIGALGSKIAEGEKGHFATKQLLADGSQLKKTLAKSGNLFGGFGQLIDTSNPLFFLVLGVTAAGIFYYIKKHKK